MIAIIGLYILFIVYAIIDGIQQGDYYHRINLRITVDWDEHNFFTYERVLVASVHSLCTYSFTGNVYSTCLYGVAIAFCFSFFHNGTYYQTRSYLATKYNKWSKDNSNGIRLGVNNPYPKGWWDQSTTTKQTKFWTNVMTPVRRTVFAVLSLIVIIISITII